MSSVKSVPREMNIKVAVCVGLLALGSSQTSRYSKTTLSVAPNVSAITFSLSNSTTPDSEDENPPTTTLLNCSLDNSPNMPDPVWKDFLVNGFLVLPLFSLLSVLLILGVVREVTVRTGSEMKTALRLKLGNF